MRSTLYLVETTGGKPTPYPVLSQNSKYVCTPMYKVQLHYSGFLFYRDRSAPALWPAKPGLEHREGFHHIAAGRQPYLTAGVSLLFVMVPRPTSYLRSFVLRSWHSFVVEEPNIRKRPSILVPSHSSFHLSHTFYQLNCLPVVSFYFQCSFASLRPIQVPHSLKAMSKPRVAIIGAGK